MVRVGVRPGSERKVHYAPTAKRNSCNVWCSSVEIVSDHLGVGHRRLFFRAVHLYGGPPPVRRFLPELIKLIWDRKINPGRVFDLTVPLENAAEGYRAMDERRATVLLTTRPRTE